MLDQCQDLFAGQARQGMLGEMGVVPAKDPPGGKKQLLAGLRRNAPDPSQMIHIGIEEWLVRIQLDAWDDEAFGNNPACKLDRRAAWRGALVGSTNASMTAWLIGVLRAACDKWSLKRPSRLR